MKLPFSSRPRRAAALEAGPVFYLARRWQAITAVSVGLGCGPSVQAVYEGSIRFEHCYRLDLDDRIVPSHRLACWREWLSDYTYGQRRDRLEYARQRVDALASGDTRTDALEVGKQKPTPREFYLSVPAPTSAYAPPPPTAPVVPREPELPPPGRACLTACETAWQSCGKTCDAESSVSAPNAGASKAERSLPKPTAPRDTPCASCERDYRACAKECLEDSSEAASDRAR